MAVNLSDLMERLAKIDLRTRSWAKRAEGVFKQIWDINSTPPGGFDARLNECIEIAQAKAGESPLEEFYAILDELCDIYLSTSDTQRKEIREIFRSTLAVQDYFLGYIGRSDQLLMKTRDIQWFQRALAAVSIQDGREDPRDLFEALGSLYLSAYRAGIEPLPYFMSMAALSTTEQGNFLKNFNQSAYFKGYVAPKL